MWTGAILTTLVQQVLDVKIILVTYDAGVLPDLVDTDANVSLQILYVNFNATTKIHLRYIYIFEGHFYQISCFSD